MTLRRPNQQSLDSGWSFRFQDEPWRSVSLPHSWNALDTMDALQPGHYRRGVGSYARELPEQSLEPGRRLWLELEAASQRAALGLGGVPIGQHLGGYTGFTVELSPSRYGLGGPLPLLVRVDNRPDPDLIPSDLSDFFLYGGLTRHAWTYRTGTLRVESVWPLARVQPGSETAVAIVDLSVRVRLDSAPRPSVPVTATLRAPRGSVAAEATVLASEATVELDLGSLPDPVLWSPEHPHLHDLTVVVEGSDQVELRVGFRHLDYPAGGLPSLNGRPLQLRGTHRHEDWAGLASAVPDALTRYELEMIRAAGLNFVRLGHYPQSPAVLDACDELGLLVWEELPWCRGGIGGEVFKDRARQMLEEMIDQHHHHPSIVFWGLANEIDWEASDHDDSTPERVLAFLRELHDLAHGLYPGRLTALRRFEPGSAVVDVYSPTNWSGWYRGRYQDYEPALEELMGRGYPRLLHIEWGGDSHWGRHGTGPHLAETPPRVLDHGERPGDAHDRTVSGRPSLDGDWSESYILDLLEWHLQILLRTPVAGFAQWSFKDFGTPLRPENPIPYVNQKGLLDRAGRPKDAYHLFRSYLS